MPGKQHHHTLRVACGTLATIGPAYHQKRNVPVFATVHVIGGNDDHPEDIALRWITDVPSELLLRSGLVAGHPERSVSHAEVSIDRLVPPMYVHAQNVLPPLTPGPWQVLRSPRASSALHTSSR